MSAPSGAQGTPVPSRVVAVVMDRRRQGGPGCRPGGYGFAGAGIAVSGAVLVVVSFTILDWLGPGGVTATFSDLRNGSKAFSLAYFTWLGWALLVLTLLVALGANLSRPVHRTLRLLGLVLGIAGLAMSLLALKSEGINWTGVLHHARLGLWVAMAGFLLVGIGAATGPALATRSPPG